MEPATTKTPTSTRRAEQFFAQVAAELGEREGDIVTIRMRQCELARRKAIAASTVAAHLRAMGGRVLQRYPVIVLTSSPPPVSESSPPPTELQSELLTAFADLAATQQRIIDLLMESATDPREVLADRRGFVAEIADLESSTPEVSKESLLASCTTARTRDDPRQPVADRAWTVEHLDDFLAPLHRLAKSKGLTGLNNKRGLMDALAGYGLDEVATAVEHVTALAARGEVRSPFGLLVRWARTGERSMFTPTASRPAAPPPKETEPVTPLEAAALRNVERWEAQPDLFGAELARLDQLIHQRDGNIAGIDRNPAMRRAFRAEALSRAGLELANGSEANR